MTTTTSTTGTPAPGPTEYTTNNDINKNITTTHTSSATNSNHGIDIVPHEGTEESEESGLALATPSVANPPTNLDFDRDWRYHPSICRTIHFPTLIVPSASLHRWIQEPALQPYLAKATNDVNNVLQHIHPRIKLVQDYNSTHKLLLLLSSLTPPPPTRDGRSDQQEEADAVTEAAATSVWDAERDKVLNELIAQSHNDGSASSPNNGIQYGPITSIELNHTQWSFGYILQQLLPPELAPHPTAYEQIGHIAHFNLRPSHLPYARFIGQVLVETNPSIRTVVRKIGQVSGNYRTYDYEIIASSDSNGNDDVDKVSLETTVVEDGVSIRLNVADCYWCTRLSGERQELIQQILVGTGSSNGGKKQKQTISKKGRQSRRPIIVADVFCGVGAICLLLVKNQKDSATATSTPGGVHIVANDWNTKAIGYFHESIRANGLDESKFQLTCLDAYDYLIDLGSGIIIGDNDRIGGGGGGSRKKGGLQQPSPERRLPDHVLMNFPLEAPRFLGALRWWDWKLIDDDGEGRACPRFHVYTFARSTSVGSNDEEEVAVDTVADGLMPHLLPKSAYFETHRRRELDEDFGANVSTRLVRDVAPGKVVVCVSFSATPKLLRYMRGDFY